MQQLEEEHSFCGYWIYIYKLKRSHAIYLLIDIEVEIFWNKFSQSSNKIKSPKINSANQAIKSKIPGLHFQGLLTLLLEAIPCNFSRSRFRKSKTCFTKLHCLAILQNTNKKTNFGVEFILVWYFKIRFMSKSCVLTIKIFL